ncbi:MAG: transposase [Anaerophaga sp.]|jgi:transposase|nr:transposase [Anaerophaga sp.]
MLGDISNVQAIYIICGHTDMRKSIDGLCAIVQNETESKRSYTKKTALFSFIND